MILVFVAVVVVVVLVLVLVLVILVVVAVVSPDSAFCLRWLSPGQCAWFVAHDGSTVDAPSTVTLPTGRAGRNGPNRPHRPTVVAQHHGNM